MLKPVQTCKEFLLSFHGTDEGLVYNLPKNVRVLLYCQHGKELSACDVNESRTWYVATTPYRDPEGKYLKALRVYDDEKPGRSKQYCVFSGNLYEENLNRIPDILLDDEQNDFRTGLFEMPARFQRVFLRDHYSKTDQKTYRPGQITDIDTKLFHESVKPYTKPNAELPKKGFMTYFIRPGDLSRRPYGSLDFVIVPKPEHYRSHSELKALTNGLESSTSPFRVDTDAPVQFDTSVVNSDKPKDIRIVKDIIKTEKGKGIYLSAVVRYLCKEHPNAFITIVATVCRNYHPALTKTLRANQGKTAEITVSKYVSQYAKKDVFS
jgi:hypothetical protein